MKANDYLSSLGEWADSRPKLSDDWEDDEKFHAWDAKRPEPPTLELPGPCKATVNSLGHLLLTDDFEEIETTGEGALELAKWIQEIFSR